MLEHQRKPGEVSCRNSAAPVKALNHAKQDARPGLTCKPFFNFKWSCDNHLHFFLPSSLRHSKDNNFISLIHLCYTNAIPPPQKKNITWIMDFHFSLIILHCFLLTRAAEGACKWFCGKYSAYRILSPCSQNEMLRSGALRAGNLGMEVEVDWAAQLVWAKVFHAMNGVTDAWIGKLVNRNIWTSVRAASLFRLTVDKLQMQWGLTLLVWLYNTHSYSLLYSLDFLYKTNLNEKAGNSIIIIMKNSVTEKQLHIIL